MFYYTEKTTVRKNYDGKGPLTVRKIDIRHDGRSVGFIEQRTYDDGTP